MNHRLQQLISNISNKPEMNSAPKLIRKVKKLKSKRKRQKARAESIRPPILVKKDTFLEKCTGRNVGLVSQDVNKLDRTKEPGKYPHNSSNRNLHAHL